MRIIGELPHPIYKVTIFEMNAKLSVKIEDKLLEQTYKFRDGAGVKTTADVEKLLNDEFMDNISKTFQQMSETYHKGLEAMQDDADLAFEII